MASIFTLDVINKFPFVDEANFIRLAILYDHLEGDTRVLAKASMILVSIYDGNMEETKKHAKALLEYLHKEKKPAVKLEQSLIRLIND